MRLLDLFCGAGGAAMGYHQAGFTEIVGVDVAPQPNYPFEFVQMDALEWWGFSNFDLVHASPPCQAFSRITPDRSKHPDLVELTRRLLDSADRPYVIENVPGAPIHPDLVLCGSMFGLQVQRHRWFELGGFSAMGPGGCNHKAWESGRPHTVAGHVDGPNGMWSNHHYGIRDFAHAQELMGMPWTETLREVTEAIPPAYTKFIGEAFLNQLSTIEGAS